MIWSWYYLIPLAFMLIIAVIWLIVFFMSYRNNKNVKSAVNDAKEVIEAFKGATGMAITARAKLAEQGINVAAVPASEEVTTTPAEPAKAATEAASAPAVAEVAAAAETPVAAENKAAEKEIPAFVKRMQYELQDLESKIYKLSAFIENAEQFNKLDEANKQLLKAQHGTMCAYYEILRRRVLLNMEQ